jgi:hypothetical protein
MLLMLLALNGCPRSLRWPAAELGADFCKL